MKIYKIDVTNGEEFDRRGMRQTAKGGKRKKKQCPASFMSGRRKARIQSCTEGFGAFSLMEAIAAIKRDSAILQMLSPAVLSYW